MYEDAFCVSPNAWGGVLNKETIPNIKAKVVCGACNNQLQFASDAQLLMQVRACCARMPPRVPVRIAHFSFHAPLFSQRGVAYVPDFVCNRMGVVNCSMEVHRVLPHA